MSLLSRDRKRILLSLDDINNEYGAVATNARLPYKPGDIYVRRSTVVWKKCNSCGAEYEIKYNTYMLYPNSVCRSCSKTGVPGHHSNLGKKRPSDVVRKTVESRMKNNSYVVSEERKAKMRLDNAGEKNPNFGNRWSQEKKDAWSDRVSNMYQSGRYARRSTKPEKEFRSILDSNNIEYTFQYSLGGKSFDFCIPKRKLLIEVDGTYWHSRDYTFESMNATQLGNYANDITKGIIANKYGFRLLRIWEDELSEGFKILLTLLEDNGRQDL
jgi:very-short-patch-repair endonuclease